MKELRWKTFTHIYHPYGDLLWHLFWGIIVGIVFVTAIFRFDYWLLVVGLIALVFFFHPGFYEPRILDIRLNEEGVYVNKKFYPWSDYSHFEIFENSYRKFIFLVPKKLSVGVHFPLEEFFVSEKEVKEFLSKFLEETSGSVPIFDKIYRDIFL